MADHTVSDKVTGKVVRLDRLNYPRWRIEVEDILRGNSLWLLTTGEEAAAVKPAGLAAGADAAAIAERAARLKTYLEWNSRDS